MNERLVSARIIYLIFFVYISPFNVMVQVINNPETIDIDQYNNEMYKAIAMRKTGIILTLSGFGAIVAGGITSIIMSADQPSDPDKDFMGDLKDLVPVALGSIAGLTCIAVGVPLKAIDERRINAKAMLSLKMFEITQQNSMTPRSGYYIKVLKKTVQTITKIKFIWKSQM